MEFSCSFSLCDGFHLSSNSTPFTLNVYDTKHVSLRLNNSWGTLASEAEKQILTAAVKENLAIIQNKMLSKNC